MTAHEQAPINLVAAYASLESDTVVVLCRLPLAEFKARAWTPSDITKEEWSALRDMIYPEVGERGTVTVVNCKAAP